LIVRKVSIEVCAVWDIAAALGPRMIVGIPQPPARNLAFVNSTLCPCIKLAVHVFALDETRRHFQPLLWHGASTHRTIRQYWFLGKHSDVGGGNKYSNLANISSAWIMAQLKDVVRFDDKLIYTMTTEGMRDTDVRQLQGWNQNTTLILGCLYIVCAKT
jgi:hypothetical protein